MPDCGLPEHFARMRCPHCDLVMCVRWKSHAGHKEPQHPGMRRLAGSRMLCVNGILSRKFPSGGGVCASKR